MKPNYEKYADGLVPAIVQDAANGRVLMLGFMDDQALAATRESGMVTFYSRTRQRLWTKGETSGHILSVKDILIDCDQDTLLIMAEPAGAVCHTGAETCFEGNSGGFVSILEELEEVIHARQVLPDPNSYTSRLFEEGINRIAQKVGEEAVELIIEAKDDDVEKFKSEAADLLFHLLVLIRKKRVDLKDVFEVLRKRRNPGSTSEFQTISPS
ncbi:MAG: bifunctional phosphoribosyl-AMP cyclohydrolase/phosphoribosyl-ATP diphosphatase HisIE [Pyrinomonadaceae bacterium]